MADNKGSDLNHPDPGPKPTSLGGKGTFTPIGTYEPLTQEPTGVNQKSDYGRTGKL